MQEKIQEEYLRQIDGVLKIYFNDSRIRILQSHDISDSQKIITLVRAVIERVSGTSSPYYKQTKDILLNKAESPWEKAYQLIGVLQSLQIDVKANYLRTYEELIHEELFGDFLEMARYLLDEGFKDAAAVIAGSSLEAHLRQLCKKNNISIMFTNKRGKKEHKKASRINDDLTSKAYSKTEQKAVIAWLDIRNNAAHGDYEKYTKKQVRIMIMGILDFINRNPA